MIVVAKFNIEHFYNFVTSGKEYKVNKIVDFMGEKMYELINDENMKMFYGIEAFSIKK